MVNWKTTIMGALAAMLPWLKTIVPDEFAVIFDAGQAFALALLGYFAKDKSVTGVN